MENAILSRISQPLVTSRCLHFAAFHLYNGKAQETVFKTRTLCEIAIATTFDVGLIWKFGI